MGTSKATPRPWKRGRLPDMIVADRIPADGPESSRADPEVLAYHGGFLLGESFSEADREFTLRAVNAHDDLVALLRYFFDESEIGSAATTANWLAKARVLLAKLDAEE